LKEVIIEDCSESPCEAEAGETVTGQLKFESSNPIPENLTCKVVGIFGGVEIPFPGQSICNLTEKGEGGKGNIVYQLGLTVPKQVPKVRMETVNFTKIDDCSQLPTKRTYYKKNNSRLFKFKYQCDCRTFFFKRKTVQIYLPI
jgi:hypothetical protein